ncbi:MAG: addiction module antidote protein, HigA family [Deltaproteobacteria bacterium]|nr:MAG: addiction module antidote protein, HigA family [Deltaproteobacteria bacterium]RLC19048.1 MAG: addiction module antidote protein, HigA family [Deltaproteobacteria bacterium]
MRKIRRQPTHPGRIIQEDYLKPLSITIKTMAELVGVSRKTMSKIINGKGSVTPDMALRLSRAFDTTPDLWLNLQKNYDLWSAEKVSKEWKKVKPIPIYLLHSNGEINSEQAV